MTKIVKKESKKVVIEDNDIIIGTVETDLDNKIMFANIIKPYIESGEDILNIENFLAELKEYEWS